MGQRAQAVQRGEGLPPPLAGFLRRPRRYSRDDEANLFRDQAQVALWEAGDDPIAQALQRCGDRVRVEALELLVCRVDRHTTTVPMAECDARPITAGRG